MLELCPSRTAILFAPRVARLTLIHPCGRHILHSRRVHRSANHCSYRLEISTKTGISSKTRDGTQNDASFSRSMSDPRHFTDKPISPHSFPSHRPFLHAPNYPSHRWFHVKANEITSIVNPTSPNLMAPVDVCPHRLLDTHTLQLVEFDETDTIPPYAILSHTWIHGQEVVYKEYVQHQLQPTASLPKTNSNSKSGYQKIQAACQKAREDGIGYIWIDTCCIKQGNHHDVAENVTCMYAYYQNAQVCYAYIADFHTPHLHNYGFSSSARDLFCWGSNWFQRGWTLQELLAPRTVVFFRKDWMCIGDKHELRDVIHHRTTIPPDILSGEQSIQDVDVLDRMSWSMGRETTRPQDLAYCLQGLLGVSIEPDYEEDWLTSFHRLRLALFDTYPELEKKLWIRNHYFYYLLMRRFVNHWYRLGAFGMGNN